MRGSSFYRVEQVDGTSILVKSERMARAVGPNSDQVVAVEHAVEFFRPADSCSSRRLLSVAVAAGYSLELTESEYDSALSDCDEAIRLDPQACVSLHRSRPGLAAKE